MFSEKLRKIPNMTNYQDFPIVINGHMPFCQFRKEAELKLKSKRIFNYFIFKLNLFRNIP